MSRAPALSASLALGASLALAGRSARAQDAAALDAGRSALGLFFGARPAPSALDAGAAPQNAVDAGASPLPPSADAQAALHAEQDAAPAPLPTHSPNCQADPAPSGHEVRVETRVTPAMPSLGDRVLVTYRLFHRGEDRVEFNPDPAAFAQPGVELEYARQQPDRDRSVHSAAGGAVYGEVTVAVQPFRTGEVEVPSQLARLSAAGDVARVCTPIVRFRVRDPFGNDPHPTPRDVTPPEEVTEDAYRLRYLALGLDGAFVVAVGTLAVSAYLRARPKPTPPPPPPRPSWEVALEALDALGKSDLLARGATKDYYDAISDITRRYVGGYRGFDALEMTTDEVLRQLRRDPLPRVAPAEIEHLLRECDLVKFARQVPSHEESDEILAQAYAIVRRSTPLTGSARDEGKRKVVEDPPSDEAPRAKKKRAKEATPAAPSDEEGASSKESEARDSSSEKPASGGEKPAPYEVADDGDERGKKA